MGLYRPSRDATVTNTAGAAGLSRGCSMFRFKGIDFDTYPKIIDYALSLSGLEQEEFVNAYARTGPHALSNIGYISGYYDRETAMRIMETFKTSHPIFGRRLPTPEEAFDMGKKLAAERNATR